MVVPAARVSAPPVLLMAALMAMLVPVLRSRELLLFQLMGVATVMLLPESMTTPLFARRSVISLTATVETPLAPGVQTSGVAPDQLPLLEAAVLMVTVAESAHAACSGTSRQIDSNNSRRGVSLSLIFIIDSLHF